MNNSTALLISIVIIVVIWIATVIIKRLRYRKLEELLATQQFDAFFTLVDSLSTRMLFPANSLTYMKLNACLMNGDDEQTTAIFDDLLARRMGGRERADLVLKAFNFFVSVGDGKRSKALLTEVEGWGQQFASTKHECRQMYDVMISKKTNRIAEMQRELKDATGERRGQLEFLLALQYEYKGNRKQSEEHLARAKETYGLDTPQGDAR